MSYFDFQAERELHEGEFLKEGLIHCSVCKKPRQAISILDDGTKFKHKVLCDCEQKKNDEREKVFRQAQKERAVTALKNSCFDTPEFMKHTFEASAHSGGAYKLCFNYCEKWQEVRAKRISLLICGKVGGGKTYLACCICNKLIMDYNASVKFITEYDYLNLYTASKEREELLFSLSKPDLLVLDDFGSKCYKKNAEANGFLSFVNDLIDTRYKKGKQLVITTNLNKDLFNRGSFSSVDEERIFSRIIEMTGAPIEVVSADFRQEKAQAKANFLRGLVS